MLQGDPWLSVEATQYVDVTNGSLPNEKFYQRLALVTPRASKYSYYPSGISKQQKTSVASKVDFRILGAMVIIILIVFLGAPKFVDLLGQIPAFDPTTIAPTNTISATPTSSLVIIPSMVTQQTAISPQATDAKDVPMVFIPSGDFKMGSNNGSSDAKPVHTVYLTDFYIDKYEVTNANYYECVKQGVCQPPKNFEECTFMGLCSNDAINKDNFYKYPQYANQPVVYVDWTMAKTYCEWRGGSLPTEAQWEKAARGTDERKYPWGDNDLSCIYANYWSGANGCVGDVMEVGKYENGKSQYGAYDFAGNVWEWVFDWYDGTYYELQFDFDIEPIGPDTGTYRVVRGGSWANVDPERVSSTLRGGYEPWYVKDDIGIRCIKLP